MAGRARRFARDCLSAEAAGLTIPYIFVTAFMLGPVAVFNGATEKKLRSLITVDTSISGFYGPGSWWAWLITLGMTHVHSFVALEEPEEWDYDLIAASGYIVAAAIDLTLKARIIGKLGDSACESPLLPALLCAQRVVWVGTGSSLFTIVTAPIAVAAGGSSGRQRAVTALIPFVFSVIALCFTFTAHNAILRTDKEGMFFGMYVDNPCTLSDGSRLLRDDISFSLADLPLFVLSTAIKVTALAYTSGWYWLIASPIFTVLAVVIPSGGPLLAGPILFPSPSGDCCGCDDIYMAFHLVLPPLATVVHSGIFPTDGILPIDWNVRHGHGPTRRFTWHWVYCRISDWETDI
ncbi:hypothetical protein MSAN_02300500 [Mycena sanguinolenta]|uniref:Uncharacterized protein n=1 Tax=Mycena sanguinolenta TaxID=230812 RepID=A0A8H7CIC5_9AGAR|nr:hypothetical protein MSAN_02300500 [Mycena sanguinolenta]